jgi:hypothetical protein
MRTFRSLLRSRYGLWILAAETFLLLAAMVALWWSWRGFGPTTEDLIPTILKMLPVALVAVYLLPALIFVGAAVLWQIARALTGRVTSMRH